MNLIVNSEVSTYKQQLVDVQQLFKLCRIHIFLLLLQLFLISCRAFFIGMKIFFIDTLHLDQKTFIVTYFEIIYMK